MLRSEHFFYYLNQVLGIKSLYTAKRFSVLKIYVEGYETYIEKEKELLQKMLGSIQIHLNNTEIESRFDSQSIYFLIFKDQPLENETYSPRVLLQNESYKKYAWEYLKSKKSTGL